jgi:Ca2+-transporting ATPase
LSAWHKLEISEVVRELEVDPKAGLSLAEAKVRLLKHGPNELIERASKSPWRILFEQFTATMVLLLIAAAIISAILGDYKDTTAILAIVFLNAVLGFSQEYKAEKAVAALKKMAVPTVKVRRDGVIQEISARELVPGDLLIIEAGNLVPADCRLIECANLRTQEASLTGESEPVDKNAAALAKEDISLADRTNMAYMGTIVTYGRAVAVVVLTGMNTELGNIATMIQGVTGEESPLQKRMDQLGKWLALIAVIIVAVVFLLGLLRGENLRVMLLTAVSLAVAAVPEGLPAVVTIALALGAQRMLKRRALIRKLPAVETLGSVTVICSDKTGTLTENRMSVQVLDVAGYRLDLAAHLSNMEKLSPLKEQPALSLLLLGGTLCNDAVLKADAGNSFNSIGDPTEGALVVAAAQMGIIKEAVENELPRIAELPFESERKRMTTVHRKILNPKSQILKETLDSILGTGVAEFVVFTKGAVDSLLEVSTKVLTPQGVVPLDGQWVKRIMAANDELAKSGMRVLGVSFKIQTTSPAHESKDLLERDLIFVGMTAMIDPPRPEVKDAVKTCTDAGIRPIMITGDHPLTAENVARQLNMLGAGGILTGRELDLMSDTKLQEAVKSVSVYARVSPEHKLKIIEALRSLGHIVAMTGDGVNDAPALKKADIGVAMGITGTDVAREASDMVLLDDNFATIVAAVREGRVIFDNIRKFIKYLLAANSAEIWIMLLAPFLGMPLPLLPLQILWINLVTDGLPALALGIEPAERNIMRRPPHKPGESVFARGLGVDIVWVGFVMAIVSLGVGLYYFGAKLATWQTMVFTTITLSEMAFALAVRSERDTLFKTRLFTNIPLLLAVASTFLLQLAVIYVPFLQVFFKTKPLSASDLMICLSLSAVVFVFVELRKVIAGKKTLALRKK